MEGQSKRGELIGASIRAMNAGASERQGDAGMFVVTPEFVSFLSAAKLATYAGQSDEASVAALLPGSKQLEYSRGPYLYRDIYVGTLHFVGQEIAYSDARAVWSWPIPAA